MSIIGDARRTSRWQCWGCSGTESTPTISLSLSMSLRPKGYSARAAKAITMAHRPSTRGLEDDMWRSFESFCKEKHQHPTSGSPHFLTEFPSVLVQQTTPQGQHHYYPPDGPPDIDPRTPSIAALLQTTRSEGLGSDHDSQILFQLDLTQLHVSVSNCIKE